ncbi:putative ankyrin repeat protein [Exaiptasia diaphana]|nr:putative ankyrin repeat protein [Exaiptasia diaphana]
MPDVDSTESSLMQAARCGHLKKMHRLIKGGANVNAVNENGETALMIVAQNRSFIPEMAISLMNGGANVNIKDKEGKTALMYAIAFANENTAPAIMENSKDLDLNAVDNRGQTALMKSVIHGITGFVISLVRRGADVNMKDKEGQTALMHAIAQRDEDTALPIIDEHSKDLDLNAVNNQGQTALMKSIIYGMTTIADALIKRGAEVKATVNKMSPNASALIKRGTDVNIKDKEGQTALMHAIAQRDEDTALAIIEHCKDLDLNAVDNQGQTALMKVVIYGMTRIDDTLYDSVLLGETALLRRRVYVNIMTRIAITLIKRGADVNFKDKEGQTALMHAIDHGVEDIALAIIEHSEDLDLNAVDNQGQTALMKSTIDGMTTIAIALVKRGADVYIKDKEGKTALMHDFVPRGEETALAIIEHNRDLYLNAVDNQGQTTLMKAIIVGKMTFAIALIKHGADVKIKDKKGKTALKYAIDYKRDAIATALISKTGNEFSVNSVDNKGQTALMKAIIYGMTGIAIAIVKRGADVNLKDKEGQTALMHAIDQEDEDIALAIIECSKDLDLNAVDNQGQTALMKAITINKMMTFSIALIKRGVDVNVKDKEGKTALMHAIAKRYEDTALAIIRYCKDLDLNAVDNQGQTALMKAVINGMATIADALITRGADVNKTDIKGRVALMYIGLADFDKDFRFDAGMLTHELIKAGADVSKSDDEGSTALMYNVRYEASVKELMQRGKAPVDSKNDQGRTALFYALVGSILSARYLVENGANLHFTDKHNVSVLSYFIHHWINNGGADENLMYEKCALLKDNGVKKETIVNALINAIFCKLPLIKSPVNTISKTSITTLLTYAIKLSRKSVSFRKDNKCRLLQYQVDSIDTDEYSVSVSDLSKRLDKLLELGADPNTCDEQGNTIAHHITLLGMYDNTVEAKSIIDVLRWLEKKGLEINQTNCNDETPLLFMLAKPVNHNERRLNNEYISDMCIFFLEKDRTIVKGTTQTGDSVFHLLIKLSSVGDSNEESLERSIVQLLRLFSNSRCKLSRIVNIPNDELNTPLHVWAAGSQPKSRAGKRNNQLASEKLNCQGPSEEILDQLLLCGAVHHARNLKAETPLHMCRTWTAVKLLFREGAKTNDVDSLGRSPLLSAAKNFLFLENPGCFYPDISPDEAPTFWETVLDMGFDLWTCDKNGDSIISILIKENCFELADGLIEITCKNSKNLQDETLVGVLNAICKDKVTHTTWKSILVDKLLKQLKSTRRPLDMSLPLRSCCMNIIGHFAEPRIFFDVTDDGEPSLDPVPMDVHYEVAKQLLRYGTSGESCLDVAEGCLPLQDLLSTPISMEERPFIIPWTSHSQKHKNQLAEVARGLNCNFQEPYWYHNKEIGRGAFGQVFVGIHGKDGMEVAVKRVHYTQQDREEDIREIRSFASLPKCEHIVRYLTFLQTADYSFIIMELMEGDLGGYFANNVYDQRQTKVLCRDVAFGLKYLHEQNIIHRDLKPSNILYKTDPQLYLKIADFGLSRRVDVITSNTVMVTGVGTRGWIAPEVMKSTTHEHSTSSDVFSCGLVFHYILSKDNRHPFSPADFADKSELEIIPKTETNILNNNMEGWDSGLDPEASHVIKRMLNCTNEKERPKASMLLHHPMFWSKKKKLDFLSSVGNQEEFECPRAKRTAPLTMVEQDLENVVIR